ncbi:MAG TPA: pilin [Candidatus Levybacteria bacterium]|nr:pilin [Candidatus Levybacteria bacterium]
MKHKKLFLSLVVFFLFFVSSNILIQPVEALNDTYGPNLQMSVTPDSIPAGGTFEVSVSGSNDRCYWFKVRNITTNTDFTNSPYEDASCDKEDSDLYYHQFEETTTFTVSGLPAGEYRFEVGYQGMSYMDVAPIVGNIDPDNPGLITQNGIPSAELENGEYIDSNTTFATVQFRNLPTDLPVVYCILTDQDLCIKNYLNGDKKILQDEAALKKKDESNGRYVVCGDGEAKLKVNDCKKERDWFHAGKIYRMGAYILRDNTPIRIAMVEFYVYHFYPDIEILNELLFGKNILYGLGGDTSNISIDIKKPDKKNEVENDKKTEKEKGVPVNNPINVVIHGLQNAGGVDRNNYQIVVEGLDNNFGSLNESSQGELCTEVESDGKSQAKTIGHDTQNGRAGSTRFLPGRYVIKINEQINDSNWRSNFSSDSCQGGFTFYHIPFIVDEFGDAYINPNDIKADPNHSEFRDPFNDTLTGLPCTKWVRTEGKEVDECVEYGTAIGSFGTNPLDFINTLGKWLFRVAAIATFSFMIYAGFIFQTSRGDKEKIAKAREIITAAITGFIFLILSVSILQIIGIDILRIPGFTRDESSTSSQIAPTLPPGRPGDRGVQ